jgi:hypothetical protein
MSLLQMGAEVEALHNKVALLRRHVLPEVQRRAPDSRWLLRGKLTLARMLIELDLMRENLCQAWITPIN